MEYPFHAGEARMGDHGIGVGLIGTGYMGKCHALAWRNVGAVFGDVPHPRLVHLAEADTTLAQERAQKLGFARATGNWRDLIADPEVEIVSITTPNAFHAEMALAALEAGKHVWCEKPMAAGLDDARRMRDAARASTRITALGYNYIQNPVVRHARALIAEGAIGAVNHVRVEMDEDFMADPAAPFGLKSEASSGHGALDDFAVHPLSLLQAITGTPTAVTALAAKPYATRPTPEGARPVETDDIATALMEFDAGVTGLLAVNRSAWGRKGRIAIQVFGSAGTIAYDQERMNELQLYRAGGGDHGFTQILSGPAHPPYAAFVPAPGHGLGFNDLKVIEAREILAAIAGRPAVLIDFEAGYAIERTVEALALSSRQRRWVVLSEIA
jgi:predicted dehydrogenase